MFSSTDTDYFFCIAINRMEAELPPPLPPHGAVIVECTRNVEYKPPVPPHRNVGVTANLNEHEGSHKRVSRI
jgi:hypothetical protein